jgi:GTP cyclohydrolase I
MVELKLRSDTMDRHQAEEAVRTILNYIEKTNRKDLPREGLEQTPERVISMFDEIFSGYQQDPSEILDSTFNGEGYDGIVLLKNIEFHSTCEHHLQPFSGHGHIAYIPVDRIVGISKLARLLDAHSKRLQNQERITKDIAEDLVNHLSPLGAAVILEASHGCMKCRGVMKQNSTMVTSSMKGAFFDNKEARNELMQLIKEC